MNVLTEDDDSPVHNDTPNMKVDHLMIYEFPIETESE